MTKTIKKSNNASKDLKPMYRKMLLLRRFEERAGQLYTKGEIAGFCHLYIGQEAVAVGAKAAIKEGDSVITSYRDHGIMLAFDADPKKLMAELCGKYTGCSKGKGGSMHIFDTAQRFYGGHGIVGAQVSLGTGIAFTHKYQETDNLCIAIMGDGAVNQGQVYESMNMAKLWNLPVIYMIENNGYAMGTSVARGCAGERLCDRGMPFGISGKQINGMDVLEVFDAVSDAAAKIRRGEGPQMLEMMTYRYRGHSMSDPGQYRAKDEVSKYREIDPLIVTKKYMLDNGIVQEDWFATQEKEIKAEVADAIEFALQSEQPPMDELYRDVYAEEV